MKKLLSIVLSIIVIISICPFGMFEFTASAATDSGYCGNQVRWRYDMSNNTLTISGEGAMTNYNWEDLFFSPWFFDYNETITSIVIEEGVTSIGDFAFAHADYLTSVSIPDTVTYIGYMAFSGCTSLLDFTIPDSVTRIRHYAFDDTKWFDCKPHGLVMVGKVVYDYKTGFSNPGELEVPEGVIALADGAFESCPFTKIILPESLQKIGSHAFSNSSIESITIPDSVTWIGVRIFMDCPRLTEITLPFIGEKRCSPNDRYQYPLGYLFGPDSFYGAQQVTQYYYGSSTSTRTSTNYYISSSLRKVIVTDSNYISYGALYNCSMIDSFGVSEKVQSINPAAFYGCNIKNIIIPDNSKNLTNTMLVCKSTIENISFPDSLECIVPGILEDTKWYNNQPDGPIYAGKILYRYKGICPNDLVLNGDFTVINQSAFSGCEELKTITIPNLVNSIGDFAFSDCTNLQSIDIPDAVTIGQEAFSNTAYYNNDGNWDDGVLYLATYLLSAKADVISGNYEVMDGTKAITTMAFNGCSELISISIPKSVVSIDANAFINCSKLISIIIENENCAVSKEAFKDCSKLEISFGQLKYKLFDKNSIIVTGFNAVKGGLSIPDTVCGYTVAYIDDSAFKNATELTDITLPDSVKSVGKNAFSGCTALKNISLSNSINKIDEFAFHNCSSLTSITIPNSVTSIAEGVFSGCSSLVDISLPFVGNQRCAPTDEQFQLFGYIFGKNNYPGAIETYQVYYFYAATYYIPETLKKVTITDCDYIQTNAFYSCCGLTSITICEGVTHIGGYAFSGCNKLTSIVLPDSLTAIGDFAFGYCTALPSISIPNGVTSIGGQAFVSCLKLTEITIPSSVTTLGIGMLANCKSIERIIVDENNTTYHSMDNCLIDTKSQSLIAGCKNSVIPADNSVTLISDYAFCGCTGLSNLTIPDTVTSIGGYVFYGCVALKSVNIPNGITSINKYAFYNCKNLTSIIIPNSVISIGTYAFYNCEALTSITIPDGVISIGTYAFYNCEALTSITIPDGVISIDPYTFCNCAALTSITIPSSVTSIGVESFSGCSGLKSITIGNSVSSISIYAFQDCIGLESITVGSNNAIYHSDGNCLIETESKTLVIGCKNSVIPTDGSVTSIGAKSFYGCSELTSITIPNSVTSIDQMAFYNCSRLTTISIGKSLASISTNAFYGNASLEEIYVDADNRKYHSDGNCLIETESKTLILGSNNSIIPTDGSVIAIGNYAFISRNSLVAVHIPKWITSISTYAFVNCPCLDSIVVDSDNPVYHSKNNCLIDTESKSLVLGCKNSIIPEDGSIVSLGFFAFSACSGLKYIRIPKTVTSLKGFAFNNCKDLTSVFFFDSLADISRLAFCGCTNLTDIYYTGIEEQKNNITFTDTISGDETILNANWHYNCNPDDHPACTHAEHEIRNAKEATEKEAGYTGDTYCKICGTKLSSGEEIPALIVYKIAYNLAGGKNAENPTEYNASTNTIILKDPTRKGYTFKGWYSDSKLTKKVTKIAAGSTGNKTLYAKWAKTYTITYKLNSGTNNKSNPKTYTKIDSTITFKNPTRKGYTFKGWYSDSKFKKKVTKIAKGSTGNKTLYAKWAKNTYKITYKLNKGKNSAKNPKTYTVTTKTITLKNPTRKGYTFKGWYSDSKYKTKVTKITKGSTGNKTLYAKWKKK